MPVIVAVSGFKDSGKTTLCLRLARELRTAGWRVGYVKHCHESVRSPESTDTGRIGTEGFPVALWGADGVRLEMPAEIPLDALVTLLFPGVDLVLVEGAKSLPLPRIWVGCPEEIPEEVRGVIGFYVRGVERRDGKVFHEGEEGRLAAFLAEYLGKNACAFEIVIGERRLPMKPFIGDFVRGSLEGMLRSLKGGKELEKGVVAVIPPARE